MDCVEPNITVAISHVSLLGRQYYSEISLPVDATIYEALKAMPWACGEEFDEFWAWVHHNMANDPNHKAWYVGVFSQKRRLDTTLRSGDRVEIYRDLTIDPMGKRKALSKKRS